ncbi:unnamed protein product [Sphagnum jensenii]|uniref:Uncharacterized protein n=1 Tax=Sphagnum jensenii TaxID=128206 RepID=A0ABP1ASY2_9BRYO
MQALFWILLVLSVMYVLMQGGSSAQQAYNNCSGYTCPANNSSSSSSCSATILYRTQTLNEKLTNVATLFNATVKAIANLSDIKQFSGSLAFATPLYIPITCRCLNGTYQAPVSRLITNGDTFFTIANEYEGLTTVQAIQAANPNQVSTNLMIGTNITIPLRCACPAASAAQQQTDHEITNFFLTFVVFPGETLDVVSSYSNDCIPDLEAANKVNAHTTLETHTTFLVPLANLPPLSSINFKTPHRSASSDRRFYIGLGIGISTTLVAVSLLLIFLVLACKKKWDPKNGRGVPELESEIGEMLTNNRGDSMVSSDGFQKDVLLARMSDMVGSGKPLVFSYEELQEATMNFSDGKRIQGSVFWGKVRGKLVGIKQMKGNMTESELKILTQVQHANLVKLVGICQNNTEYLYLVYEYAENGSISDCLHNKNVNPRTNFLRSGAIFLPWTTRIHIALDVASSLDYIHNYTNPSFVHRDVKSSNILLDGNFRAKLRTFRMAKSANGSRTRPTLTKDIVGTQGYMAPEYLEHGLVTPKADVFAFGVVLLEILSGKEAMMRLVEGVENGAGKAREARPLSSQIDEVLEGDNFKEKLQAWMDPLLQNAYPLDTACSVANLARNCLIAVPELRPNMKDIHYALSKILVSSLKWESSWLCDHSTYIIGSYVFVNTKICTLLRVW